MRRRTLPAVVGSGCTNRRRDTTTTPAMDRHRPRDRSNPLIRSRSRREPTWCTRSRVRARRGPRRQPRPSTCWPGSPAYRCRQKAKVHRRRKPPRTIRATRRHPTDATLLRRPSTTSHAREPPGFGAPRALEFVVWWPETRRFGPVPVVRCRPATTRNARRRTERRLGKPQ